MKSLIPKSYTRHQLSPQNQISANTGNTKMDRFKIFLMNTFLCFLKALQQIKLKISWEFGGCNVSADLETRVVPQTPAGTRAPSPGRCSLQKSWSLSSSASHLNLAPFTPATLGVPQVLQPLTLWLPSPLHVSSSLGSLLLTPLPSSGCPLLILQITYM